MAEQFDTEEAMMLQAQFAQDVLANVVADVMALVSCNAENEYPHDKKRQSALIGAATQMGISMLIHAATSLAPILKHEGVREKFHEAVENGFRRGEARPE